MCAPRWQHDAVDCTFEHVVRPALEEVADVDDDRVGDGERRDKVSVRVLHFEPTDHVLEEQRYRTVASRERESGLTFEGTIAQA